MLGAETTEIGNITPMLVSLENKIKEIKEKTFSAESGPQSPVTKSMNFSISMVTST